MLFTIEKNKNWIANLKKWVQRECVTKFRVKNNLDSKKGVGGAYP